MSKVIVMRGLPGSGKSTKAKEIVATSGNAVRVNKDLLRQMLHFNKWTGVNERRTVDAEISLVSTMLNSGVGCVIVDDTNLYERDIDRWKSVANANDAQFEIIDMDTDVLTCIQNDTKRMGTPGYVGYSVIIDMAMRTGKIPEVPMVLCDIDGTVADCSHRLKYINGELGKKDWKEFFAHVLEDAPIPSTIELLNKYREAGYRIIMVSARNEDCREDTQDWLQKNGIDYFHLIMRRSNDHRDDTETKKEILEKYFKDRTKIYKVIDDRPKVIRMWRENGLDVIDVGKGVEF